MDTPQLLDMDFNKYLITLKNKLLHPANWQKVIMTRLWSSQIPSVAGVYIFKEKEEIVYVGETGNLQGRMTDFLDSRHHTIRRTIGQTFFSTQSGFIQATSKSKFPEHIEILVNDHIVTNLSLAFLEVPLGRKELEELIESEMILEIRLNKRGKRKTK